MKKSYMYEKTPTKETYIYTHTHPHTHKRTIYSRQNMLPMAELDLDNVRQFVQEFVVDPVSDESRYMYESCHAYE